jgi:hypothetical protein
MTDQLFLFDLDALLSRVELEAPPEPRRLHQRMTGAERLMRQLVRRGLQPEHAPTAAALCLELDIQEGTDAR